MKNNQPLPQPLLQPLLLTVSGTIDPDVGEQIARGQRPEADYIALRRELPAELLDYGRARRLLGARGRLLERLGGPNLVLAWACFRLRRRYGTIFTDGEQVGMPLALLFKLFARRGRPRHVMIGHLLSVSKKVRLMDTLHLHRHIDRILVYSTWQQRFARQRWDLAAERVVFAPFMVDTHFFDPTQVQKTEKVGVWEGHPRPIICAVGRELRDYPTLIAAVEGVEAQMIIGSASPWSKRPDTASGQRLPANVCVTRFTQFELRHLYALSRFLVMPLYPVEFQAGVTAILEAMAMGKAVICSRTPGQTDVVVDGQTGLYVPAGDPQALRQAICYLLANPAEAERMGRNGRRLIEQQMSLTHYSRRLAQLVATA
jgi:glycosyltransferase involved in cell wall biosynthesis